MIEGLVCLDPQIFVKLGKPPSEDVHQERIGKETPGERDSTGMNLGRMEFSETTTIGFPKIYKVIL